MGTDCCCAERTKVSSDAYDLGEDSLPDSVHSRDPNVDVWIQKEP